MPTTKHSFEGLVKNTMMMMMIIIINHTIEKHVNQYQKPPQA